MEDRVRTSASRRLMAWLGGSQSRFIRFFLWILGVYLILIVPVSWLERHYPSEARSIDLVYGWGLLPFMVLSGAIAFWPELHPRLTRLRSSPSARTRLERWMLALLPVVLGVVIADAVWRNPTEAAAVATALTVAYIAYQSWQTRRAADAAERGLDTSERSLRITQGMTLEAEKTRLDQRAPAVHVSVDRPAWPMDPGISGPISPIPAVSGGKVFRLPRQAQERISLSAVGRVTNGSSVTVEVQFHDLAIPFHQPQSEDDEPSWKRPGTYQCLLAPGEQLHYRIQGELSVSDCVANAKAAELGSSPPHVIHGEIVIDDNFDNGVKDEWPVELTGAPLERVPGEEASWQVPKVRPSEFPTSAIVRPRRRSYWRSKRHDLELPTLEA